MQTSKTFDDVVVVHEGPVGNFNFLAQFKACMLDRVSTEIVQLDARTVTKFRLENNGTKATNEAEDHWSDNDCAYSTKPITKQITYFQFKITSLRYDAGVIIGVGDPKATENFGALPAVKMCNTESTGGNSTLNLHRCWFCGILHRIQ